MNTLPLIVEILQGQDHKAKHVSTQPFEIFLSQRIQGVYTTLRNILVTRNTHGGCLELARNDPSVVAKYADKGNRFYDKQTAL